MADRAASRDPLGDSLARLLPSRWLAAIMASLAVMALLIWVAALQLPDGQLHVVFLDVGQGDAILVTMPDGREILVDGGPSYATLASELGQRRPFWDRELDLVVLTHSDADHMNGLLPLFDRFRLDLVLTTPTTWEAAEAVHWWDAASSARVDVRAAERGMQIVLGPAARLDVLHPDPSDLSVAAGDNDASVVLRLTYGGVTVLLTGDLEAEGERTLLASRQPLAADVLKVAHHGSAGATTDAFLQAVNPQMAIIQVGQDNSFGHPHSDVLERLAAAGVQILRTDQHGSIALVSDGSRISLRTARRSARD